MCLQFAFLVEILQGSTAQTLTNFIFKQFKHGAWIKISFLGVFLPTYFHRSNRTDFSYTII